MERNITIESVIGAFILVFITVILFLEIIMRYFFSNSLIWGEELARYLFVWFVYTSMSYAIITKSHIKVDSMIKLVPERYQLLFSQIGIIIWILFSLVFVYYTLSYTLSAFKEQTIAIGSGIPMWLVYIGIPLGFLLSIIRLIVEFITNIKLLTLETRNKQ